MSENQPDCRLCEAARELWEHLKDPYWRLDHQFELVLALTVLSGVIGLLFRFLTIILERRLMT
jgi:hypothetical protein